MREPHCTFMTTHSCLRFDGFLHTLISYIREAPRPMFLTMQSCKNHTLSAASLLLTRSVDNAPHYAGEASTSTFTFQKSSAGGSIQSHVRANRVFNVCRHQPPLRSAMFSGINWPPVPFSLPSLRPFFFLPFPAGVQEFCVPTC